MLVNLIRKRIMDASICPISPNVGLQRDTVQCAAGKLKNITFYFVLSMSSLLSVSRCPSPLPSSETCAVLDPLPATTTTTCRVT